MKALYFLGDSQKALRGFPRDARQNAGRQLAKVQRGNCRMISSQCPTWAKVWKRFEFGKNPALSE